MSEEKTGEEQSRAFRLTGNGDEQNNSQQQNTRGSSDGGNRTEIEFVSSFYFFAAAAAAVAAAALAFALSISFCFLAAALRNSRSARCFSSSNVLSCCAPSKSRFANACKSSRNEQSDGN